MKKIITLVLVAFMALNLSAQKGLNWIRIDNLKDDYLFKYFYSYAGNSYKAIFTIPEIKPFQPMKSQIFIRSYNADLSKYGEQGIPSESPVEVLITGFNDFTVIYGSTDENKNPFLQYHKDNKMVIADAQMNPLQVIYFPVHGKKNKFEGLPTVYKSHDSTHLIVINHEILENESKPFHETPVMHYVNIFDKNAKIIWSDSVRFADIFGKDVSISRYNFEYINDKLYLIASTNGNNMKKIKPTLYLVRFDRPQSFKVLNTEIFLNYEFHWDYVVTKAQKLIVSGVNMHPSNTSKKTLFFMTLDVKGGESSASIKRQNIDKPFMAQYPTYKSILPQYLYTPTDLLPVSDGLVYVSEYHIAVTRTTSTGSSSYTSTTYYVKPITFIKFDMEGNIQWIKMIDKYIASKQYYSEYFCRAFLSNGKVVVYYYDFLDNIYKDRFKGKLSFISDGKYCMAQAVLDNEGNLKKSLVYNIGEGGTLADLTSLRQVASDKFFVSGRGIKIKTRGDFVAFFDLKEE
ncbi:MAG: hypothetical protein WCL06_02015 [Bacteroidota bacterium]